MTDDYTAALKTVALFDLADTGIVSLIGPETASFLNNISTNDAVNLPIGGGCETYFCDHRAKVLFHANLRRFDREHFALDTAPGYGAKLFAHLDRYLISEAVELEDHTAKESLLHIAGPGAEDLVCTRLQEFQHAKCAMGSLAASVRRRDCLGVPGYDLFCRHGEVAAIRLHLQSEGATLGSEETFETLRIEAGTPVYGQDIDENRFVMEVAHAARAVCYTKGCFIGQEPIVMSRDRAGQVNRLFLAMKVLDGGTLPHGTKIMLDAVEVGVVTSSCVSPRLGAPLALGYLKRPHIDAGMTFTAGGHKVEVLGYPPPISAALPG